MKTLENRIPPPLVALIFATFMWLVSAGLPDFSTVSVELLLCVLMTVCVGAAFSVAGAVEFRRARTTVNPLKPESASSMVSSGIYGVSRNPMYVGFSLFLIAWAIYLASSWSLIGLTGFILYINRFQIIPEERAMQSLFGVEYEEYSRRVRRWI